MHMPEPSPDPSAVQSPDVGSALSRPIDRGPLSPARIAWHGGGRSSPGVLDWRNSVDLHIDAFRPRGAGPAWDRVAPEVRRAVKVALPGTTYTATQLLGALSKLALHADARGLPADARIWLSREVIDSFVEAGMPTLRGATRGNYRARLLRLREAVIGPDLATGNAARLSGSTASAPYGPGERAELWSWAGTQPTSVLRRGCKLLMALGFGCGLDSHEIVPLRAHDVRATTAGGPVTVNVRGRRARLVLCRRPWERVLADLAAEAEPGSWLFRPEASARAKNTVTNFLARTHSAPDTPRLMMARARASWIVDHVDGNTPLSALIAASGVDTLHAFSRFMQYFAPLDPDAAQDALRGPK